MLTSKVDLSATQGDTWTRVIPLERLAADGRTRSPLPPQDIAELGRRFTVLRFELAGGGLVLTSQAGEVAFDPSLGGLVLRASASKMRGLKTGKYRIHVTEPRPGHPQGDLEWTLCAGRLTVATPGV